MNCARHPKVETNLRCGKCGQPICPKCTRQTPVGARCPDCAKVTRLPVFRISPVDYAKAAGTGLVLAVGLGVGWGVMVDRLWGIGYILGLLVGFVIGELVSRVVNRKRGRGLQAVAIASVVVSYIVAANVGLTVGLFSLIVIVAGALLAANYFR